MFGGNPGANAAVAAAAASATIAANSAQQAADSERRNSRRGSDQLHIKNDYSAEENAKRILNVFDDENLYSDNGFLYLKRPSFDTESFFIAGIFAGLISGYSFGGDKELDSITFKKGSVLVKVYDASGYRNYDEDVLDQLREQLETGDANG
jgi:hypothetical protein